jgi:hypothetical protein
MLETRKDEVACAAAALKLATDAGHRKMGTHAQNVMAKPDLLDRKGKNCWGPAGLGGDISIALECGSEEKLLTTDKSFEVIGTALGIDVQRIGATPPP